MRSVQKRKVKKVQTPSKTYMNLRVRSNISNNTKNNIKMKRKIKRISKINSNSISNTLNEGLYSTSTNEIIEIIDNSIVTDKLGNIITNFSKGTIPNTNHIVDNTITYNENLQTVSSKEIAPSIENIDIIDITDTTINDNENEKPQLVSSQNTVAYIENDSVIDITDTANTTNNDDVQIISYTIKNEPIEYITIHDSDEEIVSQTNEKSIKSISIKEPIGISVKTSKRKYNSPLHKNKRMLRDKNIPSNDILPLNLDAFVIDKQRISQHVLQNNSNKNTIIYKGENTFASTSNTAKRKLRPIIIDGLNIGHAHGCGTFSVKGIDLCVQYFTNRGHNKVIVFIPQHRQGPPGSESNTILNALYKKGHVCFTPSRKVENLRMTCYDDRIILNYAHQCDGVVVSNDNYRDLYKEKEAFKDIIDNRQVMITFVSDEIIVPEDQYNRKFDVRLLSDILCFPE